MLTAFPFKSFVLSALLFLSSQLSYTQQFDVSISAPAEFIPHSKVFRYGNSYISFEESFSKSQTGLKFKLYKEKFRVRLFKQDQSLKLVKEVALSNGERVYGPFKSSLSKINGKLYFIYFQMLDKADDVPIHVMAAEIDTVSLNLLPAKKLLTIEYKNTAPFGVVANTLTTDKLVIKESLNHTKILITWLSGNNNLYFYSFIDADMNQLWTKNGVVEGVKKVQLTDCGIDNRGSVYVGLRGMQNKELEGGHIIIGTQRGNDRHIVLPINQGKANEVNFVVSAKQDDVKVVGTYKTESDNLYGVYSSTLRSDFKLVDVQLTPFPLDLLEELKNDKWVWANTKEKDRGVFDALDMETYELENGEFGMAGLFRRKYYLGNSAFDVSGNIFLTVFKNGRANFCRLPKMSGTESFHLSVNKNQVIVFYNDHENNIKLDMSNYIANTNVASNEVLVAATLSEGRVIKKEKVVDLQSESYRAAPHWIDAIEPNVILVPLEKIKKFGNNDKLFRVATIKFG